MTGNLKVWDQFADIDPKFTKSITGKDYRGTSPNAHYVIKCLTELFGPVGIGFGWRVMAEHNDTFGETVIHWCRIEFWHTDRANTFEAYGQTKMAYKTGAGSFKVDEDAPKKSLTDAITKAASQIGIAANIFMGRWDDNKYVQEVNAEYRAEEKASKPQVEKIAASKEPDRISEAALDHALKKIGETKTLEELRDAWDNFAKAVRADPDVIAAKDQRKAALAAKLTNQGAG